MTRVAGRMLIGAMFVLLTGGCACGGGAVGQVGSGGESAAPHSAATTVTGTVAYRERMALPDDAVIDLWITDVTPGLITTQVVTAEASVATHGRQVPIAFSLEVPADRVVQDHDYGLRAAIKAGGQELFSTQSPVPVLTKGHTGPAQVWVKPAPGADH